MGTSAVAMLSMVQYSVTIMGVMLDGVPSGAAGAVHEEARHRLLEMKQAALKEARQMVAGDAAPSPEACQLKPGDQVEFRKRVGSYLGGWFAGRIQQVQRAAFLQETTVIVVVHMDPAAPSRFELLWSMLCLYHQISRTAGKKRHCAQD